MVSLRMHAAVPLNIRDGAVNQLAKKLAVRKHQRLMLSIDLVLIQ